MLRLLSMAQALGLRLSSTEGLVGNLLAGERLN